MKRTTSTSPISINVLLFGGDWACSHGDIEALGYMAKLLSTRVAYPLRIELRELAQLCHLNHDLAASRWPQLRRQVGEHERAHG